VLDTREDFHHHIDAAFRVHQPQGCLIAEGFVRKGEPETEGLLAVKNLGALRNQLSDLNDMLRNSGIEVLVRCSVRSVS